MKRLYKSRSNRMIDGVCGGIAEYFNVDPTLVRLTWVLLTLFGGSGVILYIVAMIIIPKETSEMAAAHAVPPVNGKSNTRFWGLLLIAVGILWLASNFGLPVWFHWWGLSWSIILPVILILAGVAFVMGGRSYVSTQPVPESSEAPAEPQRATRQGRLYRSATERKVLGVCGGLGVYLGVDPVIIRLLFVTGILASFGLVVLLYVIMAIVVPSEPVATAPQPRA
jgi:phage shock protein C